MPKYRKWKYPGVRRTPAGNWEISYFPYKGAEKKEYYTLPGDFTEKQAQEKRLGLIYEARKQNNIPAEERSRLSADFARAREDFIAGLLDKNGKPLPKKTQQAFIKTFDRLFLDFRNLKFPSLASPGQLSLPFFVGYQTYYCNDLNRSSGWRAEWIRVRTIYNRLYRLGYISEDLRRKIKESIHAPDINKKEYPEIPSDKIKSYLVQVKKDRPDIYRVLYFLCRTGRRIEEVTLIEKKDVVSDGLKPVKINIRAETRKKNVYAPLDVLDPELSAFIRTAYNQSSQHKVPFLFLNRQNKKMNQRRVNDYLVKTSLEILGFRITTHYFRHRVMTECQNKISLQDAMALTGITDVKTALRYYSHRTMAGQEKALAVTKL